jgi:hypothetical protein
MAWQRSRGGALRARGGAPADAAPLLRTLANARRAAPGPPQAPKKKVAAAPLASAKKTVKKETNPLYEKRAKNFGAGPGGGAAAGA